MENMKFRTVVVEIISLLFIVLFVYAGVIKLIDFEKFTVQIGQSPLLTPIAVAVAIIIPVVEIVISLLLAFRKFRLLGLYGSFTLMFAFTIYIVIILNFAKRVPCSCGGILEDMGWTEHLIFNIAFVLLAVLGVVFQYRLEKESELNEGDFVKTTL